MREESENLKAAVRGYDVIIVGAGPAGSTCARFLSEKLSVLLLDKRAFTSTDLSPSNKTCGGLLSPEAQAVLISQGLSLPKAVLTDPQIFAVRTIDLETKKEKSYHKFYYNMSRARFDAWLLSLVPAFIEKSLSSTVQDIQDDEVLYRQKGILHRVKGRLIIDASGAQAILRRRLAPMTVPRTYLSIQEWYRHETVADYHTALFDQRLTDFYAWTIPKEEGVIVGTTHLVDFRHSAASKAQAQVNFKRLKDILKADYGFKFQPEDCLLREGSLLFRPRKMSDILLGQGRVFYLGEAAGLISPSSAEGFSFALKSGELLAEVINQAMLREEDFNGILAAYRKATQGLRRKLCRKFFKSPFMFNKTLRNLALRSGLTSVNHRLKV